MARAGKTTDFQMLPSDADALLPSADPAEVLNKKTERGETIYYVHYFDCKPGRSAALSTTAVPEFVS